MPGDDDATDHKGPLPPFTPPKFNWNQDNLYEQFKGFKRVVEFTFKRQYEKCSNGIKCGSILNWLGVEAYPMYDNLSISKDDSGAFKTQSEFYHKLNSVADDCNFTNKEEIVKFLYLTHNQNTRVREIYLKN